MSNDSSGPVPADLDADAAREHLRSEHRDLLATTLDSAAAVAAGFETTVDGDPATRESSGVRENLRTALDRAGALDAFPAALAGAVDAAGATIPAPPVAAPPYVAVTSTGPVLRATLGDARLVVRVAVFEVVDGAFVWRDPSLADASSVTVKR